MPDAPVLLLASLLGVVLGAALATMLVRRSARRAADRPTRHAPSALPTHVLEEALGALATAVVIVDPADRVVFDNHSARRLRLVRSGRLAAPALRKVAAAARRGEQDTELELSLPAVAGSAVVRVRAAVVAEGAHAVLLADDVTEARRVESVRRDFVANVSHELKTPVGALALLAEAISTSDGDAAVVSRFSARMVHEAERLSRLVQELIDLSRLQGAEAARPTTLVSLNTVVHEAIDRSRLRADAKSIAISFEGDSTLSVRGDASQLVTAVGNLLDNAVAYSAPGTRVAVGARRRGDLAEVSVSDEGIGIPAGDLERIFERFYRVDSARSRDTGGTGLGLAIVKHVAGNHGGRVTVWSVEGTGSTFTLHLPLPDAPTRALPATALSPAGR